LHAIVSGKRVVDGDIDSGDGGAVKRSLSGGKFSHAFSGHREPVGVVDETIQDGVGQGRVADGVAPLLDGGHCQSKFYTACSRTRARWSSTVFAHELPPRSAGFDAENRLYLFALTMPPQDLLGEISNFAAGEAIDLLGKWTFSGFSEISGVGEPTLASGAAKHTFDFVGGYTQSSFNIAPGSTTVITHT
jgi:hypothetical protein